MRKVLLASKSPARLTLLRQAGINPQVLVSEVDEDAVAANHPGANTAELVELLATAKGQAVATRLRPDEEPTLIIAADSMLELDGQALGKPRDAADAIARWQLMRGKTGRLNTGHWLHDNVTGRSISGVAWADVTFAQVSDAEIAAYVATGEPLGVAGAFTHEGRSAAFIARTNGDGPAVAGLSLFLLRDLCANLGIEWHELWTPSGS